MHPHRDGCAYLAPGRYRGKAHEPAYVAETAKVLAEVRGVSLETIARQTSENFFSPVRKVPPQAPTRARSGALRKLDRMAHDGGFTILGSGSSGGVPRRHSAGAPAIEQSQKIAAGAPRFW